MVELLASRGVGEWREKVWKPASLKAATEHLTAATKHLTAARDLLLALRYSLAAVRCSVAGLRLAGSRAFSLYGGGYLFSSISFLSIQ